MKELTPEQERVFIFLSEYQKEHGAPPTVREIAEKFGYKSINSVTQHLRLIEQKGFIAVHKGRARGIEIKVARLAGISDAPFQSVPLVGSIAAGVPITAIENIDGYIALDKELFGSDNLFTLRVKGNSMREIGIVNGDIAVIQQQHHAENGQIVAAIIEGEATLKRFFRDGNRIILHPENVDFPDIVCSADDGVEIAGKLVGVIRRYR
jgi:repressor LexA